MIAQQELLPFSKSIIMLIDDNEIDLFINIKVLRIAQVGKQYLSFTSSSEAIEYLKSSPVENLPELIFLDINLPLLNGYGFLSQFDELEKYIKAHCKIIVVTSSEDDKDMLLLTENPYVSDYWVKPIYKDHIRKLSEIK